jgi:predicted alpha-1,2-mannosidase
VPGLARLMGGPVKLESELDTLFAKNEYWHGNEPGHQIPFMYNYTPSPWKTQVVVRRILAEEYNDGPGGLGGNDDAGQMSAWYMFASMGFYPLNPVSGEFILCSPLFNKVAIKLKNGRKFRIYCYGLAQQNKYIQAVKLNGRTITDNLIRYTDIMKGGKLEIYLKNTPL